MAHVQTHMSGEPVNESERQAIAYLRDHLPETFYIYHNMEVPSSSGRTTEHDIILVGEYAVYTIEVKGYKGRITGNAANWELASGAVYKSPISPTRQRARELASHLRGNNPMLDEVWVQGFVVLTEDRAELHVNDDRRDLVMHLDQAVAYINDPRRLDTKWSIRSIVKHAERICKAIDRQYRPLHRKTQIGDYVLVPGEKPGGNNLYTTYRARHRMLAGDFTLKAYDLNIYATPREREQLREWVLRDAHALHRLRDHPNIARAEMPFPWESDHIVLPVVWIDGYSLRSLIDEGRPLGAKRYVEIIREACAGLAHAHANGVIHRDLRPEHIIVPISGPAKLVNFDCARIESKDYRTIASLVGSQLVERYVAPEIWNRPAAATPSADLYALGVILYEVLTGQPPTATGEERAVPPPTTLAPGLPSLVDQLFARLCDPDPARRYASATELYDDLEVLLAYLA